jgi:hypothetical protein
MVRVRAASRPLVQAGTQRRSDPAIERAMKFIQDGGSQVTLARALCYKRARAWPDERPQPVAPSVVLRPLARAPRRGASSIARTHYDWHARSLELRQRRPRSTRRVHSWTSPCGASGPRDLRASCRRSGGRLGYQDDGGETPNTQIVCLDYTTVRGRRERTSAGTRAEDHLRGSAVDGRRPASKRDGRQHLLRHRGLTSSSAPTDGGTRCIDGSHRPTGRRARSGSRSAARAATATIRRTCERPCGAQQAGRRDADIEQGHLGALCATSATSATCSARRCRSARRSARSAPTTSPPRRSPAPRRTCRGQRRRLAQTQYQVGRRLRVRPRRPSNSSATAEADRLLTRGVPQAFAVPDKVA